MADVRTLRRRFALTAAAAAAALAPFTPAPARACSLAEGALTPTNYELVRNSEAIVLARAVRFRPSQENPVWGTVSFEVEEALAGDVRATALTLPGNLQFAGRSPDRDFSVARPGAFTGGCLAEDYRLDHRYLLFLRQYSRKWGLAGPAFSRVNEEVDGADAPWVQTVRLYLHVGALRGYDREKAALRRLRARGAAGKEQKVPSGALVADIDRHFRTPSDAKSAADLVELYGKAPSDDVRLQALWALAHSAPPPAAGFMRSLLLKETCAAWLSPLGDYFAAVEDHAVFGRLAALYARSPRDSAERRAIVAALAASAGGPAESKRLLELLRSSSTSEAAILAFGFARPGRDPRPAIADLQGRIAGGGHGRDLFLAMALAVLGDAEIVEWAERAVNPGSPAAGSAPAADGSPPAPDGMGAAPSADDRWVAVTVLAVSPLAAADGAAREVVAAGDPALLDGLIQANSFRQARFNPRRWDLLEEVLRVHGANPAVLSTLERQLEFLRDVGTQEDKAMVAPLLSRVQAAARSFPP